MKLNEQGLDLFHSFSFLFFYRTSFISPSCGGVGSFWRRSQKCLTSAADGRDRDSHSALRQFPSTGYGTILAIPFSSLWDRIKALRGWHLSPGRLMKYAAWHIKTVQRRRLSLGIRKIRGRKVTRLARSEPSIGQVKRVDERKEMSPSPLRGLRRCQRAETSSP